MREKLDEQILEEAMNYAYLIVTGQATFDDLIDTEDEVMLPYNILAKEDVNIDIMIEYYEEHEEYEKCSKLLELKENG